MHALDQFNIDSRERHTVMANDEFQLNIKHGFALAEKKRQIELLEAAKLVLRTQNEALLLRLDEV